MKKHLPTPTLLLALALAWMRLASLPATAQTGALEAEASGEIPGVSAADIAWRGLAIELGEPMNINAKRSDEGNTQTRTMDGRRTNGNRPMGKRARVEFSDLEKIARDAVEFQEKYPTDARAPEARRIEVSSIVQKMRLTREEPSEGEMTRIRSYLADNTVPRAGRFQISAMLKEVEITPDKTKTQDEVRAMRLNHARQLRNEFPDEPKSHGFMLSMAKSFTNDMAVTVAREIIADPNAPPKIKAGAQRLIDQRLLVGKTLAVPGVEMSKYTGRPLVIYTWTAKRTDLLKLISRLSKNESVRFIGVNLDTDQETARRAAGEYALSHEQIYDGNGLNGPLATRLCVTMVGSIYIVNAGGELVDVCGHKNANLKIASLAEVLKTDLSKNGGSQ